MTHYTSLLSSESEKPCGEMDCSTSATVRVAAIATRGYVAAVGDYYLCPLPATQLDSSSLVGYLEPVWQSKQELTTVEYSYANGETEEIAVGYELSVPRTTSSMGLRSLGANDSWW